MTDFITTCNVTGKLILSGNDQVDSPAKLTEHKDMVRKNDKVCAFMPRGKKKIKSTFEKWTRKLLYVFL